MPLLDHFRPPLSERRHWHSFHNAWATYLSSQLNALLPEGYFAEPNVQYGIEPAVVEVGVFSRAGGPQLAGAVELVSPANKDRPGHRDALVSKCATYLRAGVGLVVVDVVTERPADFHAEILSRLGAAAEIPGAPLYASAYRPVERDRAASLDVWHTAVSLGQALPTMPLWLRAGLCLPVELEATYERTCAEQRVRGAA